MKQNKQYLAGLLLFAAEVFTALLYKFRLAGSLAARHNDSHTDYPLFLMFAALFVFCGISVFQTVKKKDLFGWQVIFLSLIGWAAVLFLIGSHTDCCVGG